MHSTDDIVSFGDMVQIRRNDLGLTRPELARRVGCSPVTIKKIERAERRPSVQVANLLAEHLLIPQADRDRFVRMARGDVAASPTTHGFHLLPPFLATPGAGERFDDAPFVARDDELARLDEHLRAAMDGAGHIVFVTGEAGDGKTRLAQHFVDSSQERFPELVAAQGNCNAFTGIGDPYHPFRELLALLTGDIEAQWIAGKLSRRYAERLWSLLPETAEALSNVGPDLIEIFVPGEALVSRLAAAFPGRNDLKANLARLVSRQRDRFGHGNLPQSALFAQYGRTLHALARNRPLLLVVDDLQWADAGSINLLFHLARHLSGHRILILGLYRPSDLRIHSEERHPLESVVNELQRDQGDIRLSLWDNEGRQFVDAYLDTEPNKLDIQFRDALYRQTAGHPLFTVEILRGLRNRRELLKDSDGHWFPAPGLDWSSVPARIEGVIQEHYDRLSQRLQSMLKAASVQGEIFAAEVVASVQQMADTEVIRSVGGELNRQHRLVQSHDQTTIGSHRLSRYQFRHILFQQHVYHRIDPGERSSLHLAVGQSLEDLYGDDAASIAPQLARHFDLGADVRRAQRYHTLAGDAAAAAHAHAEAASHYSRALAIARERDADGEVIGYLYTRYGRSEELCSRINTALTAYEDLERLALKRADRSLELEALAAQVTLFATFTPVHDVERAETLGQRALVLARELNAREAEAKMLWLMVFVYQATFRLPLALETGERCLALCRSLDLREQMAYVLNDLGSHVFLCTGPFRRARACLAEATELWRQLDNRPMLANCIAAASLIDAHAGDFGSALAHSDEAFAISQTIDNLWGQSYSRFRAGRVLWELGDPDGSIAMMESCIEMGQRAGFMVPQAEVRSMLALVLAKLGAIEVALEMAQLALKMAEEHVPPFRINVLGRLAQIHLLAGNLGDAQSAIVKGNQDPHALSWPLHMIPLRTAACELALTQENYDQAIELVDEFHQELRQMGARSYIPQIVRIQGLAYVRLNNIDSGVHSLREAVLEAEEIGSLPNLWQSLIALSEVEPDPTRAQEQRLRAEKIVSAISDRCPTPELRGSFLGVPSVRKALAL